MRFRKAWDQQLSKKGSKKASLFAACASAVGPLFLSALPFKLINDASQFVGPVILNRLLTVVAGQSSQNLAGPGAINGTMLAAAAGPQAMQHGSTEAPWVQWLEAPLSNGYCLAFLLFFGTTLGVLADNQHFQRVMRAGFRLKAIVTAEVYRKVCFAVFWVACSRAKPEKQWRLYLFSALLKAMTAIHGYVTSPLYEP